jgi:signal transduction histidine kinase
MVIPINTFTIHNIIGFMVAGSLAVTFYIVYIKSGRHLLDLLSANFIFCAAMMCLASFLSDNVVPAGMSTLGWPNGPTADALARSTLFYHRLHWTFALLMIPTQLHFVLRYCDCRGFLFKNIRWAYVLACLAVPLIWTPMWFTVADAPMADTSSWNVAIPWMPDIGYPLLPFLLTWYWLLLYSVVRLWQANRRQSVSSSESLMHRGMVLAAFVVQLVLGVADLVFVLVEYNGISLVPLGAIPMGILLTIALTRTRMAIDRQREHLRQEKAVLLESVQQPLLYLTDDLKIHWANSTAAVLSEMASSELPGASLDDCFGDIDMKEILPSIRQAIDTGLSQQIETVFHEMPWVLYISPVSSKGRAPRGVILLATDVTQIKEAEQILRTANAKVLAAREEERGRVAMDLHDSIAQSLVATQLQLKSKLMQLDAKPDITASLADAADQCGALAREIRQICHDLYPPTLDILGLVSSLNILIKQYRSAGKQCEIVVSDQLQKARFSRDIEISLYRIAQEAMNNAVRHGQAQRIELQLDRQDGELQLTISDNGTGFDATDISRYGMGVGSMKSRINGVGGDLQILSKPGQTIITAVVRCAQSPDRPAERP